MVNLIIWLSGETSYFLENWVTDFWAMSLCFFCQTVHFGVVKCPQYKLLSSNLLWGSHRGSQGISSCARSCQINRSTHVRTEEARTQLLQVLWCDLNRQSISKYYTLIAHDSGHSPITLRCLLPMTTLWTTHMWTWETWLLKKRSQLTWRTESTMTFEQLWSSETGQPMLMHWIQTLLSKNETNIKKKQ